MEEDKQFLSTYYPNLPHGIRSNFLLVLSLRIGYTQSRWRQCFNRWSNGDYGKRDMYTYEKDRLEQLIHGDRWKEEYRIITRQQADEKLSTKP